MYNSDTDGDRGNCSGRVIDSSHSYPHSVVGA